MTLPPRLPLHRRPISGKDPDALFMRMNDILAPNHRIPPLPHAQRSLLRARKPQRRPLITNPPIHPLIVRRDRVTQALQIVPVPEPDDAELPEPGPQPSDGRAGGAAAERLGRLFERKVLGAMVGPFGRGDDVEGEAAEPGAVPDHRLHVPGDDGVERAGRARRDADFDAHVLHQRQVRAEDGGRLEDTAALGGVVEGLAGVEGAQGFGVDGLAGGQDGAGVEGDGGRFAGPGFLGAAEGAGVFGADE